MTIGSNQTTHIPDSIPFTPTAPSARGGGQCLTNLQCNVEGTSSCGHASKSLTV